MFWARRAREWSLVRAELGRLLGDMMNNHVHHEIEPGVVRAGSSCKNGMRGLPTLISSGKALKVGGGHHEVDH